MLKQVALVTTDLGGWGNEYSRHILPQFSTRF